MDFATGAFSVDGMTSQRFHFNDMFDDDVISSFIEFEWEYKEFFCDGYVSNVGDVVTIHIKPEYMKDDIIRFVKMMFGLGEESGIKMVDIVPFDGWDSVK